MQTDTANIAKNETLNDVLARAVDDGIGSKGLGYIREAFCWGMIEGIDRAVAIRREVEAEHQVVELKCDARVAQVEPSSPLLRTGAV